MSSPTIGGTIAGQTTTDQETIAPFAGVTIADDPGQTETVTVTLSASGNGTLSQLGGGSYNAGTGVYSDTGSAAAVTADLEGLVFTPTQGTPGHNTTTTFTINDSNGNSPAVTDSTTTVIAHSGPAISGTVPGQTTNDQTSVTPFFGVTITDDPGQTETVTVSLSSAANGMLAQLGNGSYDALAGTYTDTGTAAQVTADLAQLVFTPAQGTPGNSVTTTFTISDVDTASATASDNHTTLTVTSGPSIAGTIGGQMTTDQASIAPFANVVISDDPGHTQTVQIVLSNPANGTLITNGNGSYDAQTGTYTDTGSTAAVTADLNALVFTPTQGTPGQSVTTSFTITDTDDLSVSASDNGTTVMVSAGPTISGTQSGQQTGNGAPIQPFAGVVIADDSGQTENITITLSVPANGTLTHLGLGAYNATTGVFTDSGSASSVTADLNALVFTPAQGTPGQSVTTTFTISDTDTAHVTVSDNYTTVASAVGPAISGTMANQATTDQIGVLPFSGVTISDDVLQTETVTVTLSTANHGTLSHLGGGSYNAQTGVYTDIGNATSVTTDLDQLFFMPAAGTPGQSVITTFTISDTDSAGVTIGDNTTSVVVTAGPTITGTASGQTAINQTPVTPFSNVIIADQAQQTETLTVTLSSAANGTLTHLGNGSYDAVNGIYTDTGSAASVTADLEGLIFTPAQAPAGQSVTTIFTISDTDGANANTGDSTTSVIDTAGPSITGTVANQTATNETTVTPFANVVITDDPSQIETLTVTLSNAANGTLSNVGNGSYDAGTGVWTDTGLASDVTADLQAVIFTPSLGTPGGSTTTVFTIHDSDTVVGASATDNITSVVTATGPAITGTVAGQTVSDQGSDHPFATVAITDTQGVNQVVSVTLSNTQNGTLSNLGAGSYDAVNGIYSVSGTAAQVTADLNGLVFTPNPGTPGQGAVTTTFTISDTDASNVTATNATTTVLSESGPAINGTVANQTATSSGIHPFANVTIADDPGQMQTVTVSFAPGSGVLTTNGSGSYNAPAGQYTVTGTADAVTADLEALVFTPAAGIPGQNAVTTTFTITDQDSANLSAVPDSTTSVIAESGPAISGALAGQGTTDLAAVTPFANLTIADDQNETDTVTIKLSSPANGTLSDPIEGSYNSATGIYTVTDSAAALTSVLDALVFTPSLGIPGHSAITTTFTITATDMAGLNASNTATTVTVQSGPAISGAQASQSFADTGTIAPFAHLTIADDISQTETVTVTLSSAANGTLSHLGTGSYNATTGVYTVSGSASAVTTALQGLVFTPTLGAPGSSAVTTTFSVSTIDTATLSKSNTFTSVIAQAGPLLSGMQAGQGIADTATITPFTNITLADDASQTETVTVALSSPANGTLGHLGGGSYNATTGIYTVSGSATAVTTALRGLVFTPTLGIPGHSAVNTTFSISDVDTVGMHATDSTTSVIVQSGPAITGASAGQNFASTGTIAPFAHLTIADDVSQTETVTVTLSSTANGTLSHLGGGIYNAGTYTVTGSASAVTTALDGLVFTPTAGTPGHAAATTTFSVSTTDTAGLSKTDNTTLVAAQPGPAISGASAGQSFAGTIAPFAHLTIADDSSQTETVTVTLSSAANGTLSHLGGGSYNATTGVYTVSGSAAVVTTALDGLVFTPTHGTPGNSAVTTTFTVSATDSVLLGATDSTTSVVAQSGPSITGSAAGQSIAAMGTIAPFAHLTIADDSSQTETVTVTLSSAANGTLTHLGNGSYNGNTGVYTVSGNAAAVTSTLDALMFIPGAVTAGHGTTTTFSISDTDTVSLTASDSATSVIAVGGPAVTGTVGSQAITNGGTIRPFSAVTIADAVGQTETVTVTLSSIGNGSLSNVGHGSYNGTTGVYTDIGTAAAVTSDLNGLVFTTSQPQLNTGHTLTTGLSLAVTDSLHLGAPSSNISIVQTGTVPATGIPNSFVGNGTSDVLFKNSNSGLIIYWQMQNDAVQQGVGLTTASPGWNLIGTGDFTGNGTSDILFENSQSGLIIYWDMVNGHLDHGVALTTASAGWNLIGTGDFTGNGTDDLLFQNSQSGLIIYWQMQNGQLGQGVALTTATFDWQFLGVGDFSGNGTDNLLFRNSQSGMVVDWVLQNGHLDHGVGLASVALDWQFAGIGDFYGTGTKDILWENKSGLVVDWKMANGALQTGVALGTLPAGYQIAAVGNYSGTSTSDILLHNATTGAYAEWKMANGAVSGSAIPLGSASSDWKVMA